MLEVGVFHADPHPGNLVATEDGSLAYFDFGMMGDIPRHYRVGLIQVVRKYCSTLISSSVQYDALDYLGLPLQMRYTFDMSTSVYLPWLELVYCMQVGIFIVHMMLSHFGII